MTEQMKGDEMAETDELQPTEVDGSEGRETFTPRQQQMLAALVSDASVQAAAERVGVSRTTAHHWMQQPAFAKELARQRDAVLTEALAGVQTQAGRAAAKLGALLDVEDPRLCRLVCNDILNHALRVRDAEEFSRRLKALEETIEQMQKEKAQ